MRKQIIEQVVQKEVAPTQEWLDLEELAQVELTSEAQHYPIEAALAPGSGAGCKGRISWCSSNSSSL